jgi:hypothetical protein
MLEEMGNNIKTAATNGTVANQSVLTNMYSNNNAFEYYPKYIGKQLKIRLQLQRLLSIIPWWWNNY